VTASATRSRALTSPRGFARLGSIVLSSAAYAAAFPPWNQPWVAFVALVPLLWALRGLSAGAAAGAGFLWGTLTISLFGYWVPLGLSTYWQQPGWFSFLFALGVAVVFMGSYFTLFGWLWTRLQTRWRGVTGVLVTAALYVTCELARTTLLTGHPWLLLGYAAVPYTSWIQMADLGGVYLLSFAIVVVNAGLADLLAPDARSRRGPVTALVVAALVLPLVYGRVRLRDQFGGGDPVRTVLVQGNLDLGTQWREEFWGTGLDRYLQLSGDATRDRPRLVVWPESSMTFFLAQSPEYLRFLTAFSRLNDAQLLAGGPHAEGEDGPYYNSAFLVGTGGIESRYDKVRLLPFAEYFPLHTLQLLRRRFERVQSFTPASELRLLDTNAGKAGVLICFEAVFPDLVRREVREGAEILVNLSNDAWLQSAAGAEQHLLMVRLRAVETRRWVVRATTTGVSAFIDFYGRLEARLDAARDGTLSAEVARSEFMTPYVRWGDLFAAACVAATVLALVATRATADRV
jgi:apolipoprotein N-acyltransferase